MKLVLSLIACLITFTGCNNTVSRQDSWNLLGGAYEKHGEMLTYNDYWVEAYRDTTNRSYFLLLVYKDTQKFISDSLRIGVLPEGVAFDYGTVERNGQQDRSLVVLYKPQDSAYHYNILKAWRANVETGKFEVVPNAGIRVVPFKE